MSDVHEMRGFDVLQVPCCACGSANVHHGAVDVGYRPKEDETTDRRIVVEPDGEVHDGVTEYEGRRQDVALSMWCESCGYVGRLVISQHKGRTLIGWRVNPAVAGKLPCEAPNMWTKS